VLSSRFDVSLGEPVIDKDLASSFGLLR